jgi:hypothetical protein
MATIAKLDSNGVQVLPEGRGKTTSPQVHSSTDLTNNATVLVEGAYKFCNTDIILLLFSHTTGNTTFLLSPSKPIYRLFKFFLSFEWYLW